MRERLGRGGRQLPGSAYERSKRHFADWIAIGVILSVGLHYALFSLFPQLRAADVVSGGRAITAIKLPPVVNVPPPPQQIARPAIPRIGAFDVAEDVTIAPTTFEANPVDNLPPPPPATTARAEEDRPRFIPYDTPPKLLDREETQKLLRSVYPATLREARIEGRVVIRAYVDITGKVGKAHIHQSSGFDALDRAALEVAREMQFFPARNRDKKTPVWVQQAIVFSVQ